jgi:hypothetical protein
MGHGNEGRHFVAVPLSVIRMDERFDGVADQLLWPPARQLRGRAGEPDGHAAGIGIKQCGGGVFSHQPVAGL